MKLNIALSICIGIALVGCAGRGDPVTKELADTLSLAADGFTVELPQGVRFDKTRPVEDFVIYKIVRSRRALIYVYIGDNPKFPLMALTNSFTRAMMECPGFRCLSVWKDQALVRREVLIRLRDPGLQATYLHAWTASTGGEDLKVADMIIWSLKTRN